MLTFMAIFHVPATPASLGLAKSSLDSQVRLPMLRILAAGRSAGSEVAKRRMPCLLVAAGLQGIEDFRTRSPYVVPSERLPSTRLFVTQIEHNP
jgi:hypothetical protein